MKLIPQMSQLIIPDSCDTMVALPNTTSSGHTIFAKNSDRPAEECQPLQQMERMVSHRSGDTAGCQYVEVPQVQSNFGHIGSRPYWCWGYEHGFNEYQVVIGNEGLRSKLPSAIEPRLFGMELVRLGLERGRTASQAVDVITSLVSEYGQGKFKKAPSVACYDNGFIVADPVEAYVIETADHEWAVKRVESTVGISNVYSLGTNWDRISPNAKITAVNAGLWKSEKGRLDFSAAYGDHRTKEIERLTGEIGLASNRRARSCTVLAQNTQGIDVSTMIHLLRDHSDGGNPGEGFCNEISATRSICTHYGAATKSNTAASLVADLCSDGSRVAVYWYNLYAPCLSAFLPMFSEGKIPEDLSIGSEIPSDDSPWWVFHNIERKIRQDDRINAEIVQQIRSRWINLQDEFLLTAYDLAKHVYPLIGESGENTATKMLTEYMRESFNRAMVVARNILVEL